MEGEGGMEGRKEPSEWNVGHSGMKAGYRQLQLFR